MQLKRTYLAIVASAYLAGLLTSTVNAASAFPYGGGRTCILNGVGVACP